MRTYKEIPFGEQLLIAKETISFYLLSETVEARKDKDLKALQDALVLIEKTLPILDSVATRVLVAVNQRCEEDDTFEVFEDILFNVIENEVI